MIFFPTLPHCTLLIQNACHVLTLASICGAIRQPEWAAVVDQMIAHI